MRLFYLREAAGLPSIKAQKAALGLDKIAEDDPVYIDLGDKKRKRATPAEPFPELALAIQSLRKTDDDELAVAVPAVLGGSRGQVLDVMQAIGAKQASIFNAETGEKIPWVPEALKVLEFATEAETFTRKFALKKARVRRAESGKPYGKPAKLTGKKLEAARAVWMDPALTRKEAAEKLGFSPAHGYRIFGPAGLPPLRKVEKK